MEQGEYWDFSSLAKVAQMPQVEIIWSEIWMNLVFWSEICVNLDQSGCGGGVCVGGWTLSQDRPLSPSLISSSYPSRHFQGQEIANCKGCQQISEKVYQTYQYTKKGHALLPGYDCQSLILINENILGSGD